VFGEGTKTCVDEDDVELMFVVALHFHSVVISFFWSNSCCYIKCTNCFTPCHHIHKKCL